MSAVDVPIVLSALRRFDLYERVKLDSSWFAEGYRSIYQAIKRAHDDQPNRTIPWKDLRIMLKGTKGYGAIAEVMRRSKHVSKVMEHKQLSQFVTEQMLHDIVEDLAKARETGEQIEYGKYIQRLEDAHKAGRLTVDSASFFDRDISDWIEKVEKIPIVETPIQSLNQALKGGMPSGHITTLMAKTDGGKTSLSVAFGAHALRKGLTVLHCTMETPELELGQRYWSSLLNHSWDWIQSHPKTTRKLMFNVKKSGGHLQVADFTDREPTTIDVKMAIEQLIRRRGKIDLLIVDCGDDVRSARRYEKETEEQKEVWKTFRRFGVKFSCPVFITTQSNRKGAEAEVVELWHIGECFAKAKLSSELVIMDIPKDKRHGQLILAKTKRRGVYPKIPVIFSRDRCTFK
jgi:replicative DNA helicase